MDTNVFTPKKALVLTKFSRYEFERRRFADYDENELIESLKDRGSDYQSLILHHNIHTDKREKVIEALKKRNIEVKVVNRFEYTTKYIDWADVIITTGGDGTFLMGASKIFSREKPIIGVNSDPTRSVGYLCLPTEYTDNFSLVLDKLEHGQFKWKYRQRIKIFLNSDTAYEDPIELHDQQLTHPEFRFYDIESHHEAHQDDSHSSVNTVLSTTPNVSSHKFKIVNRNVNKKRQRRLLPIRALNEVFIGETVSSRVSYYELSVNNGESVKLKSSGLTVCTGTGSTSWSFNMNKVTLESVRSLFKIIQDEAKIKLPEDDNILKNVTKKFNNSLVFEPDKPIMAYTIRDPLFLDDSTHLHGAARGFCSHVEVKSRMFDACVVIDGSLSYKCNDGSIVELEISPEDELKTVSFD